MPRPASETFGGSELNDDLFERQILINEENLERRHLETMASTLLINKDIGNPAVVRLAVHAARIIQEEVRK